MLIKTAAHSITGYKILMIPTPVSEVPLMDKSDEVTILAYKTFYAVLTLLMTSISEQCLYIVRTKLRTPNDVWVTLHEHFLPSTNRNMIRLHGSFYQMNLQAFPLMSKYIDSINMQAKLIN